MLGLKKIIQNLTYLMRNFNHIQLNLMFFFNLYEYV